MDIIWNLIFFSLIEYKIGRTIVVANLKISKFEIRLVLCSLCFNSFALVKQEIEKHKNIGTKKGF